MEAIKIMWDEMQNMAIFREFCELLDFDTGLPLFFSDKRDFYDFIWVYSVNRKIKFGKRNDVNILRFLIDTYTDRASIRYRILDMSMSDLKKLAKIVDTCLYRAKFCYKNNEYAEWAEEVMRWIKETLKEKVKNRKKINERRKRRKKSKK